jgi:glucokinase
MGIYLGLDIGGTKIMAAAADKAGNILRRARVETSRTLQQDLDNLNRLAAELAEDETILGIGAAIGGPLDWERGIVSPLHQPAWRGIPLKEIMGSRWKCPFWVDVDTNVAAMGEYRWGGGAVGRLLYITISTGMGGGFLVDGKVYRGAGGGHPEIAHQSINFRCSNPSAIQCECGVPDCLEALVSGNGIRRIYGVPAEGLAAEQWDEIAYNLGQGLRNLADIYMPDEIRLGGGVAVGGGEPFINKARDVMREHVKLVPPPEVALSRLGYDTALMGAVALAINGFGQV